MNLNVCISVVMADVKFKLNRLIVFTPKYLFFWIFLTHNLLPLHFLSTKIKKWKKLKKMHRSQSPLSLLQCVNLGLDFVKAKVWNWQKWNDEIISNFIYLLGVHKNWCYPSAEHSFVATIYYRIISDDLKAFGTQARYKKKLKVTWNDVYVFQAFYTLVLFMSLAIQNLVFITQKSNNFFVRFVNGFFGYKFFSLFTFRCVDLFVFCVEHIFLQYSISWTRFSFFWVSNTFFLYMFFVL